MLDDEPLRLPQRPAHLAGARAAAWREPLVLPTYRPADPDVLPAYLDRRVYQGSSGRVYPLPFHDRIASEPEDVAWDAVHLENDWLRVVVLPELGGRIHVARDLTRGEHGYDFFYANPVIKPALVGLAGPWIAGGVEFNWPQHHRPATYLPTDCEVEHHDDGSVTAWCSDHDPFARMKGMHGVRLHPERAVLEVHARLYNRSEVPQTFLWWANVAARVHDDYQSFFPRDVVAVADHAERAVTAFPAADGPYYGVDYPARHDAVATAADGTAVRGDRLDWYRNIPVPTSYMAVGSREGFFGGYDHAAGAGFVHVADPVVAVGKKQWTWGNAPFGHAWDANLSDDGAHYVELMAGVFTTNQPDFAHLAPGETKVFHQTWAPFQDLGPVHAATTDAAVRVDRLLPGGDDAGLRLGVAAFAHGAPCRVVALDDVGVELAGADLAVGPGRPGTVELRGPGVAGACAVEVRREGAVLVRWEAAVAEPAPLEAATAPPPPGELGSVEELWTVGAHLEQYRHATRSPEPYWREALALDAGHAPSRTSLARAALRRGELEAAEQHLRAAVARRTRWNAHPADTEAHYLLGVVLEHQGRPEEAHAAFGAASWTRAWRAAAGHRMARLDARAGRDEAAWERLADVLRAEPEHLQARALGVLVLRRLGHLEQAEELGRATLALDPLDHLTRHVMGLGLATDAQTCLDVALDLAAVGDDDGALTALAAADAAEVRRPQSQTAVGPLVGYHRAALLRRTGDDDGARAALVAARTADARWCFPGRLDDALVLAGALRIDPTDARAHALLGHWLYAAGRREDAAAAWRASAAASAAAGEAPDAVVLRNAGLAAHDVHGDPEEARRCYDAALAADPGSARLVYESDQLDARRGVAVAHRLEVLERAGALSTHRDDTTVQLAHLLLTAGRLDEAHDLLTGRRFQPWEGGEGQVLAVWDRACQLRALRALDSDLPRGLAAQAALALLDAALDPPSTLGEARHPLASPAALLLARGDALALLGDADAARAVWTSAAAADGDFTAMAAEAHSEATASRVEALRRLGRTAEAAALTDALDRFTEELAASAATVDYFATSLPSLLLFSADPEVEKARRVEHLRAQVELLRDDAGAALRRLEALLERHPDHHAASDLAARPVFGLGPQAPTASSTPTPDPDRDNDDAPEMTR